MNKIIFIKEQRPKEFLNIIDGLHVQSMINKIKAKYQQHIIINFTLSWSINVWKVLNENY